MRLWITMMALFLALAIAWHLLGATAWAQTEATGEEGGPDVLFLALITTASFLGAAVLSLALYFVRMRIGFWLHRPPPRESGDAPRHH